MPKGPAGWLKEHWNVKNKFLFLCSLKNKLISDLDLSLLDHFFWLYKTAEGVKADTRIRSFRIDDGDISISELVSKLLFKLLYLSRLNICHIL